MRLPILHADVLVRWAAASALSFGFVISVTWLLAALGEKPAFAIALVAVTVMNFLLMRGWVFRSRGNPKRQAAQCLAMTITSRSLEYWTYFLLLSVWELNYLAVATGVMVTMNWAKFVVGSMIFVAKDGISEMLLVNEKD